MNTHKDQTAGKLPARLRRSLVTAAVVLAAAGAGFASGAPGLHYRGPAHPMAMDPAAMDAHIDQVVAQLAGDASAEQQARVAAVAKQAVADLRPVYAQRRQTMAQAHVLLMAPVIDRAALEQLRAAHVQQADAGSRRMLDAVADAAGVLTPAQRARFAGHLRQMML